MSDEKKQTPERAARPWPFGYLLLWLIAILSLLMNAITLHQIVAARQAARQAIGDAVAVLEGFQRQSLSYTVVVDEILIIDTDVPLDETIPVSIDEIMPVDTIVTVTVDGGILGPIPLKIPIQTDVPVDLDFDVPVNQSFRIAAAVPVYFEVPVRLSVGETSLYGTLEEAKLRLLGLSERLDTPLLPLPGRRSAGGDAGE
jgi:hypothetical protein